jgi:hypothetical protein
MAMADPRDPRWKRSHLRPVGESLDTVAEGLDTTLKTLNSMLGEVISVQRESNHLLEVISRSVSDERVVRGGVGGVAPPSPAGRIGARQTMLAALPSTRVDSLKRNNQPYTAGIEYTIDAQGQAPLAQQTRTGVRQGVANWLTGRSTYLADQYSLHEGEHLGKATGNVYRATPGVHMDARGNYHDGSGKFVSTESAITQVMSAEERATVGSKLATSNVMSRMGQAWAGGEPIGRAVMAGLPQTALKAAGVAGVVLAAGNQAIDWTQGQAASNRKFQEAYGGSNIGQLGERADQFANHWRGRFSMLGADNYDKLFEGAMGQGLRGSQRGEYINIGAGIMGQGVNAQQTQQLMDMSLQAGLGLAGLTKAIKDVSQAARDAGINAGRARDMFISNYEASSSIMFGSQNLPVMASLLTQGQLATGRQYQNISTAPSIASPVIEQARATQLGMNLGQFQAAQMESPAGAIAGNEAMIVQALDQAPNPGGGAPMRQVVNEYLASHPNYNPRYNMDELGMAVLEAGFNQQWCQQFLALYKISVSPGQAPGYLANMLTPESQGNQAVRNDAKTAAAFAPRKLNVKTEDLLGQTPQLRASKILGVKSSQGYLAQAYLQGQTTGSLREHLGQPGAMADFGTALNQMTVDPAIAALLNQSGVGLGKGTKIRVITSDGPKIITLEQALKDFPDQVMAGNFVAGVNADYIGKTGAEITGAPMPKSSQDSSASATKSIKYGLTDEQFADEEAKKKKDDPKVTTFTLTPAAAQILTPLMESTYYSPSAPPSGAGT